MRKLTDILKGIDYKVKGKTEVSISSICFDSRKVSEGDLFVAMPGTQADGHQFIGQAISKGAVAILCEKLPEEINPQVSYVIVESSHKALGVSAANYYNNPSEKITLVGITGTNGKTSVATLLYQFFKMKGNKVGLLSTVRNFISKKEIKATHTTPDPVQINQLLSEMMKEGCTYCFMEVSSHALDQERVTGLKFSGAVFTNLTHDHLDYHFTFANYLKAKKSFFDHLSEDAFALVNIDDKNGKVMVQNTRAEIHTYAIQTGADFKAKILEKHFEGTMIQLNDKELWTYFIGAFNVYNITAVYAAACLLGVNQNEVLQLLSKLKPVEGRFETFRSDNGITAVVDYAHTPDAVENVLKAIEDIRSNHQNLLTVIGAGGDRDRTKRPLMAKIAAAYSNKVILTSDNPRTEDPKEIIDEMKAGIEKGMLRNVLSIQDRKEAIRTACLLANPDDIVLVAGKGHETYQEINGVRHHFDDREVLREIFTELKIN